jgi:hypothetical protein
MPDAIVIITPPLLAIPRTSRSHGAEIDEGTTEKVRKALWSVGKVRLKVRKIR